MKDNTAAIKEFLDKKPSLSEILEFIETEAERIATEKKGQKNTDRAGA